MEEASELPGAEPQRSAVGPVWAQSQLVSIFRGMETNAMKLFSGGMHFEKRILIFFRKDRWGQEVGAGGGCDVAFLLLSLLQTVLGS